MRQVIISNAIAHNKFLTQDFFIQKRNIDILRFCHPLDRIDYANKLKLSKIEIESLKHYCC